MKVCYEGFAGDNHSWAIIAQNISRGFIELGHSVDIFSTNGNKYFPEDLKLIGYAGSPIKQGINFQGIRPGTDYNISLSYTAMHNFPRYLQHSKKNRFGIWCYEFNGHNSLPVGFAKNYLHCDKILAPSTFAREVFLNSGIPEDRIVIIPHGINIKEIDETHPYPLKTKKSVKILINLGQIHKRKNLPGALEIFGKAFSKRDDVCLVMKIQDRKPSQMFELDFNKVYRTFEEKFPQHAEVEIIREFLPNIYSLYKSCDITFSPSNAEGFGMVPLEGLACGLLPVASKYGGFLDFLNKDNSLLIEGKEFNVPPDYLYYQQKTGTIAFKPDTDDGVEKLRRAVDICKSFPIDKIKIREDYSWLEITKKIMELVE